MSPEEYGPDGMPARPEVSIGDLTGPPAGNGETLAEVRRQLGLPGGEVSRRPPSGPDVHGLAEGLGLK